MLFCTTIGQIISHAHKMVKLMTTPFLTSLEPLVIDWQQEENLMND